MAEQRKRNNTQDRILSYIQSTIDSRGYPPSVREIGEAVGLKSTSTVHGHLMRLEKKGLLIRDAMKPRAMGIPKPVLAIEPSKDSTRILPIIGDVAAGPPILAEEFIDEHLAIPQEFAGDGEHFILRIRGNSMIQAGILNNDYVVVRKQSTANNGEIVVALIDDEATVKRFYKEYGHFRLQPENDSMMPIIVPNVIILGKVVSLFRKI